MLSHFETKSIPITSSHIDHETYYLWNLFLQTLTRRFILHPILDSSCNFDFSEVDQLSSTLNSATWLGSTRYFKTCKHHVRKIPISSFFLLSTLTIFPDLVDAFMNNKHQSDRDFLLQLLLFKKCAFSAISMILETIGSLLYVLIFGTKANLRCTVEQFRKQYCKKQIKSWTARH